MSLLGLALLALVYTGCVTDPLLPGRRPTVTAHNLPVLTGDAYYELWVSVPITATNTKNPVPDHASANYYSIGRFRPDKYAANQTLRGLNGEPVQFELPSNVDPSLLSDAILTVENKVGGDTIPGPRFLAGDFKGSDVRAIDTLTFLAREAFGSSFYYEAGSFVLAAPTSANAEDSARGIWFAELKRDPFSGVIIDTLPSLVFPSQPLSRINVGWAYQAWLLHYVGAAVTEKIPLGKFYSPSGVDVDGAGAGAGTFPDRTFNVPGSDFVAPGVQRQLNDSSYGVVVSLEPASITLDAPFMILLQHERIDRGFRDRAPIDMARNLDLPQIEIDLVR